MERSSAEILEELRRMARKGDHERALVDALAAAQAREAVFSSPERASVVVEQVLLGSDAPPEAPDQAL